MIALEKMKALFSTCDERYRAPMFRPVLERWSHDEGSESGVAASSNFVQFFREGGRRRVLRISVDDVGPFQRHSLGEIAAELDLLRCLGDKGFPANAPVRSTRGRWVEAVVTPLGVARAVVFEALEGEVMDFDELPPARWGAWGAALGAYHNAVEGYREPGRPAWSDHLARARAAVLPEDALARAVLEKLEGALAALPVTDANYGLIHYDFCADNLMWGGGDAPGIIDFDDCQYDWFAADLAYAVRDLVSDRASRFDPAAEDFRAVLEGYRSARALSDEDVARIPLFLMENHLLKYLELQPQVEAAPVDEPQWAQGLREKLRRKVAAYREEFEWFIK